MKNTKLKIFVISGLIATVLLAGAGYYTYTSLNNEQESTDTEGRFIKAPDEEKGVRSVSGDEKEAEELFPDDMTEYGVQNAIHQLSHQKIKAKDGKKWGAIQITPERINRLIEVIEANDYEHKSLYLEILNNWKDGDFSKSDHEHNEMWRLQGGTIGEATGLLSSAEEKEFIEQHFN